LGIDYMLDTNMCSFIIRQRPAAVVSRLQSATEGQDRIVVSVITYFELLQGTIGREASARHASLVEAFIARVSDVLPWSRTAAEEATMICKSLAGKGTPISLNDAMIAGHAIAAGCVLVTNNLREFSRVATLVVEDWTAS
jgi:tRNA(fMet)-specific endonuclease VapC